MARELKVLLTPVPLPDKWVFVVGCYNSGTTLLSELLGSHPSVSALPTEGQFITDQFVKDYAIGLPRMWTKREEIFRMTEDDVGPDPIRIKKEWGLRLDRSKAVLLEKSPPNAARTRWLQYHFENAFFIALVRNGYAVTEGIARKASPKHLRNGWSIADCAHQWRRSNEILLEDARHLRHCMWVKYEDLTEDTSKTLMAITDFLGIKPLSGLYGGNAVKIHERHEPVRNMNAESISRLDRADLDTINRVAGDLLHCFDYSIL